MKPFIAALLLASAGISARAQGDTNPPPPAPDSQHPEPQGVAPVAPHKWQADPVREPAPPPAALNKITDTGEINPNAGAAPGISVGPPITAPSANPAASGGGVNI